jgi:hypothetical protein
MADSANSIILEVAKTDGGARTARKSKILRSVWLSTVSKWIKLISNQNDPSCR